jgi:hypothetical protein
MKKILTDVYMYDPILSAEIGEFAAYLDRVFTSPLPTNNYDLVLDVIPTQDAEIMWSYYFVDHDTRILFWLDPYDCTHLLSEVPGVHEASHVSAYSPVRRLIQFGSMIYSRASTRVPLLVRLQY